MTPRLFPTGFGASPYGSDGVISRLPPSVSPTVVKARVFPIRPPFGLANMVAMLDMIGLWLQ